MDEGVEMVSVPRTAWESMEARLAEMERRLGVGAGPASGDTGIAEVLSDRRSLLKRATLLGMGAVAGGAVLAVGAADPAAASTGNMVYGTSMNAGTDDTSLQSSSEATFSVTNTSNGVAIEAVSTHADGAALQAETQGSSPAVWGRDAGFGTGICVYALLQNPTNSSPALQATTEGTGNAVSAVVGNASNSSAAIYAETFGTGSAILGQITNPASTSAAVGGLTNGTGPGFGGLNIGTGPGVSGQNWGTGPGIIAGVVGASNSQPAMAATTAGTGAAVQGTATGTGSRGGVFAGVAAQAQLKPGTGSTHPISGQVGDLYVDSAARLWFCKVGGTPATWTQVA